MRHEVEKALMRSEEYSRFLIENTLDVITVLDREGNIVFESPSGERVLGFRREERVDKNAFEFLHPDDLGAVRETVDRLIANPGKAESLEYRARHRNGSWRTIESFGTCIIDGSRAPQIIINSRDSTERKKREEEVLTSQKLESLSTLAGGIAHDFNNVIMGIAANIELAKLHATSGSELYVILKKAEYATYRARDLAQQLLTFSMGGDPVKKIVLPGDLVKDAAGFALRGSRSGWDLSVGENLSAVEADEGQMRQVIHNIVVNADEAMPEGGMIRIACENATLASREVQSLAAGEYVRISFTDQGSGIPREHLSRIFDPFFTTRQKASGLGLATSYSVVKKHGGAITVQSEVGTGTTIALFLPAAPATFKTPGAESIGLTSGSGRILLMDDEEIIRDVAGKVLQAAGYDVDLAADGNEAVELYRKSSEAGKPFDVVILDLTVPGGVGGKATVKKLLEIDPSVKAIVSSGYSEDPIMANYRDYGFVGVIVKPYKIREMSEAVRKATAEEPSEPGQASN